MCGNIADESIYYLIREGQDITEINEFEIQRLIEDGFRTIHKEKEHKIISHDRNFQKITYEYNKKLNSYIYDCEDYEEQNAREQSVFSALLLHRCNEAISEYMQIVYKSVPAGEPDIEKLRMLYDAFIREVERYEYDKYLPDLDLRYEDIGIKNLLNDLNLIHSILEKEAEPILKIIEEYKESIRREAIEKNIPLYHISATPPEEMHDNQIKPSYNKSQYLQNFGKMLCASTEEIESNPYLLARANGGILVKLPIRERAYLIDKGNVSITRAEDDKTCKLTSNRNGYIYYLPIENFKPVVCLQYDRDTDDYKLQFDNEWISEKPINIPDQIKSNITKHGSNNLNGLTAKHANEVYAIESYTDVTSVLEHNQIFVNNELDKDDINYLVRECFGDQSVKTALLDFIQYGKIGYVNREANINYINIPDRIKKGIKLMYNALSIINGPSVKTTEELKSGQASIRSFIKRALQEGITYGEYVDILNNSARDNIKSENKDDKRLE